MENATPHSEAGWAHGVIYDDLNDCGCGHTAERLTLVRQALRDCPLYDGDRWRAYDNALAEWLLCAMTAADLIEHGSSLTSSWATDKGRRLLAVLNDDTAWAALTTDEPTSGYCECAKCQNHE